MPTNMWNLYRRDRIEGLLKTTGSQWAKKSGSHKWINNSETVQNSDGFQQ